MPQKVITVTGYPDDRTQITEIDFPKVSEALEEGYTVKEIKQVLLPASYSGTWFILTFVLEKS
jgi:hypothetical protein